MHKEQSVSRWYGLKWCDLIWVLFWCVIWFDLTMIYVIWFHMMWYVIFCFGTAWSKLDHDMTWVQIRILPVGSTTSWVWADLGCTLQIPPIMAGSLVCPSMPKLWHIANMSETFTIKMPLLQQQCTNIFDSWLHRVSLTLLPHGSVTKQQTVDWVLRACGFRKRLFYCDGGSAEA